MQTSSSYSGEAARCGIVAAGGSQSAKAMVFVPPPPDVELVLGQAMPPQGLLEAHFSVRDRGDHLGPPPDTPLLGGSLSGHPIGRIVENIAASPHGLDVMLASSCRGRHSAQATDKLSIILSFGSSNPP
jgi:hypothetical protein